MKMFKDSLAGREAVIDLLMRGKFLLLSEANDNAEVVERDSDFVLAEIPYTAVSIIRQTEGIRGGLLSFPGCVASIYLFWEDTPIHDLIPTAEERADYLTRTRG